MKVLGEKVFPSTEDMMDLGCGKVQQRGTGVKTRVDIFVEVEADENRAG